MIVAALDEPRAPQHTGGAAAAPLFAETAAAQLAAFGILTQPAPATATATRVAAQEPAPAPAPVEKAAAEVPAESIAAQPVSAEVPPLEVVRIGERVLVPNFLGRSVREVEDAARDNDLKVDVSGHGHAVAQDPPAGSVIGAHEARVVIRFSTRGGAT